MATVLAQQPSRPAQARALALGGAVVAVTFLLVHLNGGAAVAGSEIEQVAALGKVSSGVDAALGRARVALGLDREGAAADAGALDALHAYSKCLEICKAESSPPCSNGACHHATRGAWEVGKCLSEDVYHGADGAPWACDVAHCPRAKVDEDRRNQCSQTHWVEIDLACELLRFRNGLDEERRGAACQADGYALRSP